MAHQPHDCLFPVSGLPVSGEPLEGLGGRKSALALGLVGAGIAALFICASWSVALVGAVVVLVLSALESELFLLLIIFMIPLGWSLKVEGRLHDVPSAVRSLVIVGFFFGRFWRGRVEVRRLLSSSPARGSLFLLAATMISIFFVKGGWTQYSSNCLYRMGSFVGFFFLVSEWADSPERVGKILRVLLYSTAITAAFAILQEAVGGRTSFWGYLNPSDNNLWEWDWRASSFLNYSNCLAGYLNLILPFALACSLFGQGTWKKLGGWTVGLGFLALLSTQSLGGLLAFVSIIVLAIFCSARSGRRRWALLTGVGTLICLLYLLKPILNPTHTEEAVGFDAISRLLLWGTAWNYFIHSPILGVGWGNFAGLYGPDLASFSAWIPPDILDVNNIYLQLLAETGLVGFLAFFYLVAQSWRQAWSQWRSSLGFLDLALAFGVLGALLSVLVHGFVDFLFHVSPQFGTLFWVLLALLVANGRLPGKSVVGTVGVFGVQA